jgi:glycosyltransferase involved in cell wall biosynthesis
MKIVLALGWYFPEALGGTEVYVNGLAQRLAKRGHQVSVVAPLRGLAEPREYQHDGIRVFRFPLIGSAPTRDECQTRVSARGSEFLREWLAKESPDLLHVHTLLPGLSVFELEAARAMGARIVMTSHLPDLGYICQRGTLMRWGRKLCDGKVGVLKCSACSLHSVGVPLPLAYPAAAISALIGNRLGWSQSRAATLLGMADLIRYRRQLQRRLLSTVNAFVLLNRGAMERVLINGARREQVTMNGLGISSIIDPKPAPSVRPTSSPVRFGYVGRITAIKGVTALANAWRALPPELAVELEWVGAVNDMEGRTLLARLKEQLGADNRVRFLDAVPASEVGEIMRRLDVLIVPSECFENGPTVVHEAFAAGTPVIGTRIGAMPELIQDRVNGRLLTPGSVAELRDAIREIAVNPTETVDAWRRALPVPRTMEQIVIDYERLYREAVQKAPSTAAVS